MNSSKKYILLVYMISMTSIAAAQQIAASCILVYERGAKSMRADGNEAIAKNFDNMKKAVIDVYNKEYAKGVLDKAVAKDRKYWESVDESELVARIASCNKDVLGLGK